MSLIVNIGFAIATIVAFATYGIAAGLIVGLIGGIVAIRVANAERRKLG